MQRCLKIISWLTKFAFIFKFAFTYMFFFIQQIQIGFNDVKYATVAFYQLWFPHQYWHMKRTETNLPSKAKFTFFVLFSNLQVSMHILGVSQLYVSNCPTLFWIHIWWSRIESARILEFGILWWTSGRFRGRWRLNGQIQCAGGFTPTTQFFCR